MVIKGLFMNCKWTICCCGHPSISIWPYATEAGSSIKMWWNGQNQMNSGKALKTTSPEGSMRFTHQTVPLFIIWMMTIQKLRRNIIISLDAILSIAARNIMETLPFLKVPFVSFYGFLKMFWIYVLMPEDMWNMIWPNGDYFNLIKCKYCNVDNIM